MGFYQLRPSTVTKEGTKLYKCDKCECEEFLVYKDGEGKYIECAECYTQTDVVFTEDTNGKA